MKNYLYYAAAAAALALSLSITACGGNDDDSEEGGGGGTPVTPQEPSGEMQVMSPTESKKFLESTAEEFLGKFRAADQRDLIVTCSYFSEVYGDLEAPDNFDIDEDEDPYKAPSLYMKSLAKALSSADASRAGGAAATYVYSLDFSKFKGVYEPGVDSWIRTGDSNDIVFRFKNASGQQCELKATASATVSDIDYVYKVRVPQEVNVVLTAAGTTLADAKVTSNIDIKGHKMNLDVLLNLANVKVAMHLDGNDNKATQTSSLTVSGETLMSSTATVNGNHLCDIDYIQNSDDRNMLTKMLTSATASMSVLDKIRVDGQGKYNAAVHEALTRDDFDSDEYDSKSEAEAAAKRVVDILNSNIKADVRFNNKETVQASLLFKSTFEDWSYSYWEYMVEPLILFPADQTTYSFEEYFESGFAGLDDALSSLIKSYEKVWDSAVR